jgi:hypothetical protein
LLELIQHLVVVKDLAKVKELAIEKIEKIERVERVERGFEEVERIERG